MKIAAAYIRVSTEEQIEYSPESQIKAIRDYAKRNDIILPEEFIFMDEGISGRTVGKRPAFMKMIGIAKTKPKPFDVILLWKFSRFARNREDSIVYKSMLRKQLGIDVVSISENLGDDKMSVLFEAMIEAMDEYYSINLAEEVKRGMTEKAMRGEPCCAPPFGYKMINKQYIIDPKESKLIKQVFEWFDKGVGMLRIAKNLNEMGVRTHHGNKIENRTIRYWLNNPVYIGKLRWMSADAINQDCDNADGMIVDGTHEALIDEELWRRVQERIRKQKEQYRKRYKPSDKISHWLVGISHCGICGGPLVNCNGYMYCNNHNKGACPGNGGITVKVLENLVFNYLADVINDKIPVDVSDFDTNSAPDTEMYQSLLKRAEVRMQRVKDAYENGIDTLEEYSANKRKIQAEIDDINAQMQSVYNSPQVDKDELVSNLKKKIAESMEIFQDKNINDKEKNTVAREFIRDIVKTGDDGRCINIMFRF